MEGMLKDAPDEFLADVERVLDDCRGFLYEVRQTTASVNFTDRHGWATRSDSLVKRINALTDPPERKMTNEKKFAQAIRWLEEDTSRRDVMNVKDPAQVAAEASKLIPGAMYYIVYRPDNLRTDRAALMRFMYETDEKDASYEGGSYFFDARPVFGTQELPKKWVKSINERDPHLTPYVGKKVG